MRITTRWQPQKPVEGEEFASTGSSGNSNHTTMRTLPSFHNKRLYGNNSSNNNNLHQSTSSNNNNNSTHQPLFPGRRASSSLQVSSPTSISSSPSASSATVASKQLETVWVKPPPPKSSRRFSQRLSSGGSSVAAVYNDQHAPDEESSEGGAAAIAQRVPWGWKKGLLVEQTKDRLAVQLLPPEEYGDDADTFDEESSRVVLDSSAWGESIVHANNFEVDAEGNIMPPNDLITLTHLNEPAVLESLRARYAKDIIYTHTGAVLLALNPFCTVRGLYGETAMRSSWSAAESGNTSQPPHVYGIADAAFRSMQRELECGKREAHQSILVSGESGAGKTVTTKFVMKYLAALSQRLTQARQVDPTERAFHKAKTFGKAASSSNNATSSPSGSDERLGSLTLLQTNSIEGQVLQSNPILESFGNARTVRNDNSSRFGKFIEIQFNHAGQLVGASVETYLLEKVRLVHQSMGERNYHVFYELFSMDARQLSHYFIAKTAHPEDFKLTASGTYDRRDGVTDAETYKALRHACASMKFDNADLHAVFCVTAALLHASNLTLVEDEAEQCCLDMQNVHLTPVCHLLGVTPQDLEWALCQQTLTVGRNQTVTKRLSLEKAIKGLEALLKAVYGALFEYLVRRINQSVACQDHDVAVATVRVLDIFGFESFHVNSFEQLCINYCNETLQQQFNAFVLKNEQAEYEREGIEWSFIAFEENQDVLDLIDKRGQGILSLLDDQCRAPGPSDKAFMGSVLKQCTGHTRFSASRFQEAHGQFSICHYAGCVEYTTFGFVEKNRDELSKEGTELVRNSSSPFVQELADIMQESHDQTGAGGPHASPVTPRTLRRSDSSVGRATVGGQFRRQLRHLRAKIDETTPHYIRCLKPNDMLVPDQFDAATVAEQLRCGGILEAVRVARAGFTQHYSHAEFLMRYRCLAKRDVSGSNSGPSQKNHSLPTSPYYGRSSRFPASPKAVGAIGSNNTANSDEKTECKDLIRVLYRKMQDTDGEQQEPGKQDSDNSLWDEERNSPAKARSYSFTPSAPRPSWSKTPSPKSSSGPFSPTLRTPSPAPTKSWKQQRGSVDTSKGGIQLGKTKVFLRHKAFQVLECIRSRLQRKAATLLNSLFRRYLARCAYIPYRDAFRQELRHKRMHGGTAAEDEFKETKEQDDDDHGSDDGTIFVRYRQAMRFQRHQSSPLSRFAAESLVDKWVESQIRNAIHNPVPRHEWGKAAPSSGQQFKWVLSDGLWVRGAM